MFDIENFPTRAMAKDMMSMISPIYDRSYVGKWIFEIFGLAMGNASDTIRSFDKEAFPNTATSNTLAIWEEAYGIEPNPSLSDEERRRAIVAKRNYKRPMNPARIAAMVTDITGRPSYVRENTAPFTYEVCVSPGTSEAVLDAVRTAIEQIQQPKTVVIVFETPTAIKIRADPRKNKYPYDMTSTLLKTGTHPEPANVGKITDVPVELSPEETRKVYPYVMAGVAPEPANIGIAEEPDVSASVLMEHYEAVYKMCGLRRM